MDGKEWSPRAKHTKLAEIIGTMLTEEARGVRDVYYGLEARGYDYTYDEVVYNVKRGRRAGLFDPSKIIDPSRRAVTTPSGITDDPQGWLSDRIMNTTDVYGRDFWEDQPAYVEVWLEKRGLASVFSGICNEYNVRLEPTHGDWSDTKAFQAAQRLARQITQGKHVRILYFGDYNPSGYRTPVAIQQMMYCYGLELPRRDPDGTTFEGDFYEVSPWEGFPLFVEKGTGWECIGTGDTSATRDGWGHPMGSFDMERIALTTEQIERFAEKRYANRTGLPENPNPSDADSDKVMLERFKRHVSNGRDVNIELNALKEFERDYLEDLIEENIEKHVDETAREDHREKVHRHEDAIDRAIEWDGDTAIIDTAFDVE